MTAALFFFLFCFSRDHLVIKYCNITAVPQLQGGGGISPFPADSPVNRIGTPGGGSEKQNLPCHPPVRQFLGLRETGLVRFPELPVPFFH